MHTIGTRAQVWHGNAKKTSGGLTKSDLFMNKAGRIVSKSKHFTAKKEMRLLKFGYGTKKGKFGFVKVGSRKHKRSKKMRGGMMPLYPSDINDSMAVSPTFSNSNGTVDVQLRAGMSGGRRRHSRHARGGSGMAALSPQGSATWSGDGISGSGVTNFGNNSTDVQMRAGLTGGKRHHKMRGGTTKPFAYVEPSNPLNLALGAN